MAKKKISELPAGSALNGTELVPIVQTGTTKRITAQDIANLGNASGVEGSGTINYLAKFSATSMIANSQIFDNGTNVGIGTATPFGGAKLQIKTSTNINIAFQNGTLDANGVKINAYNDAASLNIPMELNGSILYFKTGETERMRITSAGNVGIGTTSPAYLLDVNGTARVSGMTSIGSYFSMTSDSSNMGALGFNRNAVTGAIYNSSYSAYQLQNVNGDMLLSAFNSAGVYQGNYLTIASTGLATFSSSVTATSVSLTAPNSTSNGLYIAKGDSNSNFNGIVFQGVAISDVYLGRAVGNDDLVIRTSTGEKIRFTIDGVIKFGGLTTTQINALTPSAGMTIFNTTLTTLCFYDGTGWKKVSHSNM
jgi:hypothetical protein